MSSNDFSRDPGGEGAGQESVDGATSPQPDRLHRRHIGFESARRGKTNLHVDDGGDWTNDQLRAAESLANIAAIKGDPTRLYRFVGSSFGRSLAILHDDKSGQRIDGGEPLRRGSFDTWIMATKSGGKPPAPTELFERRLGVVNRYSSLRRLAACEPPVRRAFLAHVTAAVSKRSGVVWLPGLSIPEQFDVCLAIFPWSFMERVDIVSHPDMASSKEGAPGQLTVFEGAAGQVANPPDWLPAYVERLDIAITKSTADFARRLEWIDEQPKFHDPKGFIQVVTAWFGFHKDALDCQKRVGLVLHHSQVPTEVRLRACERLIEQMASDQDPTLLDAIADAGKTWRDHGAGTLLPDGTPLPDKLLGILADRLRAQEFGGHKSVLSSEPLEVLSRLASVSLRGMHGVGGRSLLELLKEIVEKAESVAEGDVGDWVENLRAARKQEIDLPRTCRRLVARIWQEYANAECNGEKRQMKLLVAQRKELARLGRDLQIGDADLVAVRHESDAAMVQAFARCRSALGSKWLARALRLHAGEAQRGGQSVEAAARKALGVGERVGYPYTKAFFRALCAELRTEDADQPSLRDALFRATWLRIRGRDDAHAIARRLRGACRKAKLRIDVDKLAREAPLPWRQTALPLRLLAWGAASAALLMVACVVAYLVAPDFTHQKATAVWQSTLELWAKAVAFVAELSRQGEQK